MPAGETEMPAGDAGWRCRLASWRDGDAGWSGRLGWLAGDAGLVCPVWGGGSCSDAQSILTNAYRGVTTEGEGSHCQSCAELRTVSAAERQSDKFNVGIGRDAEKVYDKL